ncbi:hypothetical protein JRI60_09140 [Archangium violaceum]|uniref:hypothetical protein n=1 Tax=Archangium violaceum TaxID=83451 RepID=UPI00195165AC|nr:hypothetical protein [Archangium violaceum]QRN99162.1 hypothetical protein JRI60_09140 [Archangium violaceum]
MPIDLTVFATPVLRGQRFDHNPDPNNVTIPVDVLPMLEEYRMVILETARALYHQRTGARVPAGFDDSFALRLGRVEPGSTIPTLLRTVALSAALIQNYPAVMGPDGRDIFEEAREVVGQTISAISQRQQLPRAFPRKHLNKLRHMSEHLEEGESLELRTPGAPAGPRTTRALKDVIRDIEIQQTSRVVSFVGQVTGMDTVSRSFTVRTRDGVNIDATYGEGVGSEQEVVNLLRGRHYMRAEVEVDATFDVDGKLKDVSRLLSFMAVTVVAEATVKQLEDRFEVLGTVESGWLDGKGAAVSAERLPWTKDLFLELMVEDGIPKPRLYPTPTGDIEAEWSHGGWEVVATIVLMARTASVTVVHAELDDEDEGDFNLNTDEGRTDFAAFLRKYLNPTEEER